MIDRDEVVKHYVVAMLWTATNDAGDSFEGEESYTLNDLPEDVQRDISSAVTDFLDRAAEEFGPNFDWSGMPAGQIGHDLWLTSAHHGAGFWDRGLPKYVRHVDTGQESGYGYWHPVSQCMISPGSVLESETRSLGDILTQWLENHYASYQFELDGEWWSA